MLWENYQIYLMILYGILFLSDITDKIYEFMDLNRETQPDRSVAELFQQYVLYGGMPYLWNLQYQEQPVKQYLRDLFNAVELKDIIRRKQIRDVDMLERILTYVTANIGKVAEYEVDFVAER